MAVVHKVGPLPDFSVSVVIPTHNRSRYLSEAIESILMQTYPNIELIVVDDGSTDGTRELVSTYGDKVRYVYQDSAGLSSALNTGIKASKGRFLAFLDDDDLWKRNRIERSVEAFGELKDDVGVVCVDYRYFIDGSGSPFKGVTRRRRFASVTRRLVDDNFIPINTVLLRRQVVDTIGGFDPSLKGFQDWEFLLRIAMAGFGFRFVDDPLALIRVHPDRMSYDSLAMAESAVKIMERFEKQTGDDQELLHLVRRSLAKRKLLLGLHLGIRNNPDDAMEQIRKAIPADLVQTAQKLFAISLASLCRSQILQRIQAPVEFALSF